MIPELRPYQARALEELRARRREGKKRILLVSPTGSGKAVLSAAIVQSARERFDAKVLFIAHRLELIDQAVKQFARWGVTDVGVMRGNDDRTNPDAPVQVATIQTLLRRNPPKADIVIPDEAHLCASDGWTRILTGYPDATILGATATPCRGDGKPLGAPAGIFEAIVQAATYRELIEQKHIVEPRCFGVPEGMAPKLDRVHVRQGDYVVDELEEAMLAADVLGDTVMEWQKHLRGLRSVIFACTVKHSQAIVARLAAAGARAAHVDANTPLEERRDVARKLRSFELEVVSNVGVYLEGWDEPCVKGVGVARPTKSLVLHRQMTGRALRPWNENTPHDRSWRPEDGESLRPVLVDQGGNIARHGFPHEDIAWSLETVALPDRKRLPRQCIKCRAYLSEYPCIACGFAPEVSPRIIREDRSKDLVELQGTGGTQEIDPRKMYFDSLVAEARQRGYKVEYASFRYRDRYNEMPPWSWRYGAKDVFARDMLWQQRVTRRQQDHASRSFVEEALYPTNEEFSDWLKDE